MRTTKEVPASLSIFGAPPMRVAASVVQLTMAERATRALTGLGACWGLAVLAVFIPVAHFVLVPTLLMAGIVVGVRRLREDHILTHVHGACPRCGLEQDFQKSGGSRGRWTLDCAGCRNQLVLVADQSQVDPI